MVVRFVKSLLMGEDFVISSETDLAQYITEGTVYTSSNEAVATVGDKSSQPEDPEEDPVVTKGVISGVTPGSAIITAIRPDGEGVEINVKVIGIEIDKQASGVIVDQQNPNGIIKFENKTEIKFSAITPNHIIRTKVLPPSNTPNATVTGIEVEQPTDTTVIVKATSSTAVQATIALELVDRHSEYVGIVKDLDESYTNIEGDTIDKTYTKKPVKKGIKIWDSTNKCYRYIDSFNADKIDEGEIDQQTGELVPKYPNDPGLFYEITTLDPKEFYKVVYPGENSTCEIAVSGVKLPNSIDLGYGEGGEEGEVEVLLEGAEDAYINVLPVSGEGAVGNTGIFKIGTIESVTEDNETVYSLEDCPVTTDSVRIETWPMNLELRPTEDKTAFVFDLNSAIPYNYKIKSIYNNIEKNYELKVLGDRLILSNKLDIENAETRTKVYNVKVGEVSAVEYYSNPVRDRNFVKVEADTENGVDVELFWVGTVQLARFNEPGTAIIKSTYDNLVDDDPIVTTIQVNVIGSDDDDQREDQDPKNDCVVTFNTNGGSKVNKENKIIVDKGSKLDQGEIKSSKKNNTLVGWFKDSVSGTEWKFGKDTVEGDMTLVAKWQAINQSNDNGGGDNNPQQPPVVEG